MLATKRVSTKLTCHTFQTRCLLPATMKRTWTVFKVINKANDQRVCLLVLWAQSTTEDYIRIKEHRNWQLIFFSAKIETNQVHQGLSFKSAYVVACTGVLSTSLLVSRFWAFGENPFLPEAYAWGLVQQTSRWFPPSFHWKTVFLSCSQIPCQQSQRSSAACLGCHLQLLCVVCYCCGCLSNDTVATLRCVLLLWVFFKRRSSHFALCVIAVGVSQTTR